jgi:hypothetical protein
MREPIASDASCCAEVPLQLSYINRRGVWVRLGGRDDSGICCASYTGGLTTVSSRPSFRSRKKM